MRLAASAALTVLLGEFGAHAAGPPLKTIWRDEVATAPYAAPRAEGALRLQLLRQDFEELERRRSVIRTPMAIGQRHFEHGLGTHSVSHIRVSSPAPIERFSAWVGVDHNVRTEHGEGSVVCSVTSGGKERFRSPILRGGMEPVRVDLDTKGATSLDLLVGDAGDGPACDHADWADAAITLQGGKTVWLDEIPQVVVSSPVSRYPFSFLFGGKPSDGLLDGCRREGRSQPLDANRTQTTTQWTDPATGLRLTWEQIRYADYPALEWVLYFENTGKADTPILQDIQALDLTFSGSSRTAAFQAAPRSQQDAGGTAAPSSQQDAGDTKEAPYRLHRTNGSPSNPTDFEARSIVVKEKLAAEVMGGGGGRSSNRDFPFFKIETARGSAIIAVGWSGQWQARVEPVDARRLRVTAGLERTHFLLHPGEKVRSPRMLALFWEGDTQESNAQFRQLVYKHHAATRVMPLSRAPLLPRASAPAGGYAQGTLPRVKKPAGGEVSEKPLPTLFCNTCFTRGGGWLNECNAENQISLIKAYAPLGLEALLTDAGWFEGGWPAGAGNWTPRKDAYPQGMGPVAASAKAHGMIYGLWFEPERVVAGTWLHKNHPEWLLASRKEPQDTYLLNFGLREVQDYFFGIVKGFMDLPGFRFYRQDFNMDPLPYWRHSDPPDRQGISEIRYIEGLYAYWDRIAEAWPDSLREECASGGRRIDLETVRRFHIHQKTDYWFDDDVDQAALWGLSQYLPNNTVVAHLNRLDDYSFHSTLASSLCLGWIADAPDFDAARGKKLLDRYREVRHLLLGAWYPLLPYTRDPGGWIGSQYHRPDLGEGMILLFRHAESPYRTAEVTLQGLDSEATYELTYGDGAPPARLKGAELMGRFPVTIPERRRSVLIVYRRARGE